MSDFSPPPKNIQSYVFGAILILLFILVCRLFAPFLTVLLWSTLLYIIFSPLHQRLTKNLRGGKIRMAIAKNIIAAVFSLITVILILALISFVVVQFVRQIVELNRTARDLLSTNPRFFYDILNEAARFVNETSSGFINLNPDIIMDQILLTLTSSLQNLLQFGSLLARDLSSLALGFVFMIFCLFFFYLDGGYLSSLALHIIPIRKEYLTALTVKFNDIARNLFFGYFLVALAQSLMGFIIFSIFQVKSALVFAVLVLICSFIPMFGAGLVWFPLALVRVLGGDLPGGILFFIAAGFFISTLDNFLRPLFLQDRIKLHPMVIFFSILGGVMTFGFNGLILGPMLVILFLTVLDLFLAEHKIELD
jgi:predicted PurR-regulated permease PerM